MKKIKIKLLSAQIAAEKMDRQAVAEFFLTLSYEEIALVCWTLNIPLYNHLAIDEISFEKKHRSSVASLLKYLEDHAMLEKFLTLLNDQKA